MRLKDVVVSVPPNSEGLNNNQLQRSSHGPVNSEEIENLNDTSSSANFPEAPETGDFRVAQDTTTWSSIAIARDNKNLGSNLRNNINNNFTAPRLYQSSSAESLDDFEGRTSSHEDSSHDLTPSDWSDWSEEGNLPAGCRGIVNPNYPGFQHLAPSLLSDTDLTEDEQDEDKSFKNDNEFNNNINEHFIGDNVNRLDGQKSEEKIFYEKPKFNIQTVTSLYETLVPISEKCLNYVKSVEVLRDEEKVLSPEPEVIENNVLEAETHQTVLEAGEVEVAVADFTDSKDPPESLLSSASLESHQEREVAVEVEVVELSTSVNETLQFPEIEEIVDSSKTSEIDPRESREITVEQIDLIREAEILSLSTAKIGNQPPARESEPKEEPEVAEEAVSEAASYSSKLEEIDLLSSIGRDIGVDLEKYVQPVPDVVAMETGPDLHNSRPVPGFVLIKDTANSREDTNKITDSSDTGSADAKKKEKMARNQARRRQQSSTSQRRPDKRRADNDHGPGGFDVYNIETAMPKIDLDAIESHLRAAREEERRRRNDREEIRRRLAMGPDAEDLRAERGRKPSLQSRLQSGMNLQICFMNETPSDTESPGSETDVSSSDTTVPSQSKFQQQQQQQQPQLQQQQQQHSKQKQIRPQVLSLPPLRVDCGSNAPPVDEADFFARQARLQTEARMALAQAKEMAHMQMEVERQRLKQSPITEMVRCSLEKVGIQLGEDRRRLSRVLLTELNVAQLQVVANDLHARIAALNEALVEGLLRRDDLHMEQDSMLVDVEDLTRYLGAKQESLKKRQNLHREQQQQQQQEIKRGSGQTAQSKKKINSSSSNNNNNNNNNNNMKFSTSMSSTGRSFVGFVRK